MVCGGENHGRRPRAMTSSTTGRAILVEIPDPPIAISRPILDHRHCGEEVAGEGAGIGEPLSARRRWRSAGSSAATISANVLGQSDMAIQPFERVAIPGIHMNWIKAARSMPPGCRLDALALGRLPSPLGRALPRIALFVVFRQRRAILEPNLRGVPQCGAPMVGLRRWSAEWAHLTLKRPRHRRHRAGSSARAAVPRIDDRQRGNLRTG
jgi:hypothetical protein